MENEHIKTYAFAPSFGAFYVFFKEKIWKSGRIAIAIMQT